MMRMRRIVRKVTRVEEGGAKYIHDLAFLRLAETRQHLPTNTQAEPCQHTATNRWTGRRRWRQPLTGCPSDPPPSAFTSQRRVWTNEQTGKVYLLRLSSDDPQKAILSIPMWDFPRNTTLENRWFCSLIWMLKNTFPMPTTPRPWLQNPRWTAESSWTPPLRWASVGNIPITPTLAKNPTHHIQTWGTPTPPRRGPWSIGWPSCSPTWRTTSPPPPTLPTHWSQSPTSTISIGNQVYSWTMGEKSLSISR